MFFCCLIITIKFNDHEKRSITFEKKFWQVKSDNICLLFKYFDFVLTNHVAEMPMEYNAEIQISKSFRNSVL